jgi:amino acid transporter
MGFSNANYALSEVHNPARTLRIAGPLAIIIVTVFYLLCNIAYYAAASKEEITNSGRLVAALLFKNVWGPRTERILSAFVALSALGNILSSVCFLSALVVGAVITYAQVLFSRPRESSSGKRRHSPIQLVLGIQLARKCPTGGPWSQ